MSLLEVAAGLSVLAGALLQSAVGFGFSLVCAPLVFAATTPERAIGLLMLLSIEVNVLTLAGEHRRPDPLWRTVVIVLVCALPGLALGLAVLRAVDKTALQIALTVTVFVSLAVQRWARRHEAIRPMPAWGPPVAGFAAGALSTSTSAAGPPLVLLLRGRGTPPHVLRDTLTLCFLALGVLGGAALLLTGTSAAAPSWAALLVLGVLVAVGHVAGRPVFAHLARRDYEPVLTAVLTVSAVSGLLVALF